MLVSNDEELYTFQVDALIKFNSFCSCIVLYYSSAFSFLPYLNKFSYGTSAKYKTKLLLTKQNVFLL